MAELPTGPFPRNLETWVRQGQHGTGSSCRLSARSRRQWPPSGELPGGAGCRRSADLGERVKLEWTKAVETQFATHLRSRVIT
jgi:hypothetical protein